MSYVTEPAFIAVAYVLVMLLLVVAAITESVKRASRERDAAFRRRMDWIRKN